MTENQDLGTGASAPDAGTQPGSAVQPEAQKPIDGNVTQLLTALSEKLDGFGSELRGLQGRQQKTDNKFSDFQQQLARLNQYKQQGLSDTEALAEMEADDRSEQRWTTFEKKLDDLAARIAGGGTQANEQQSVAKVFEAVGLDPKDPRVAVALTKRYENADQVELAAYRLQRDLAQSPNPTPAQSASLQGGNAQSGGSIDALTAELQTLYKNPTAPGAMQRITEIGDILKKAG